MTSRLPDDARRLLRLGNVQRDLDDELSFHFEQTVEELVSHGMPEAAARAEAMRRFGSERQYRRELATIDRGAYRTQRWTDRFSAFANMLATGARSLARSPGLTLGVVLAFALGIGANAIMFGIIDRLLLRAPPGIVDADRVSHLYFQQYVASEGKPIATGVISYPDYTDLLNAKSFSEVAAESDRDLTIGSGVDARKVEGDLVTGNFFHMLGTKPAIGRFFNPADDYIGGAREAVISYEMWRSSYGGDSNVLGKTIDFGYGPYTIIGVTPRGFTGVGISRKSVYLPLRVAAAQLQGDSWAPDPDGRNWQWIQVYARLADGVSFERAQAEATSIHAAARAPSVAAGDWGKDPSVVVGSMILARGPDAPGAALVAKLLAAVSLLVLLVASVNVANLLLARTLRQSREIAIRLALGISRTRLIGQLVIEGLMLAALGGIAALGVERWGGAVVRNTLFPDVAWSDLGADPRVIGAVCAFALIAGIISAAVPSFRLARRSFADVIREAGAGGITRMTSRVRTSLALAQAAFSVILLIGAGLFIRSLRNAEHMNAGVDIRAVSFASPRSALNAIPVDERDAIFERGVDRLARVPGVESVALASTFPLMSQRSIGFRAEGVDSLPQPPGGGPYVHGVSPGYFAAMGLHILRGRAITPGDRFGAERVVVINANLARYVWHSEDVLGKCLYLGDRRVTQPCTRVVGVASNAINRMITDTLGMQYYVPLAQGSIDSTTKKFSPVGGHGSYWIIRTHSDAVLPMNEVRNAILSLDPRIRYADVREMRDRMAEETRAWRLGAVMFAIFGALALVVAGIGLYSVLAFDIAQRTRELGLRRALGATATQLIGMIVSRAVLVTGLGVVIGGVAAFAAAPRIDSMLFRTSPRDPVIYAGVAAILLLVAIAAAAVPGRRATRVDPNVSLRSSD